MKSIDRWIPWGLLLAVLALSAWAGVTNFDSVTLDSDLIVGDDATITDDLTVTDDATVGGDLSVTGAIAVTGTLIGDANIVTNASTAVTLTAAQSGSVIHDTTSTTSTITLPTAAAGLDFTVLNVSGTTHVDPGSGDQILRLTNAAGDKITTASAGATIRLIAADATNWFAIGDVDGSEWTDGN